jgi:anti-sigma factor ChrR (cupin superfamily)
MDNIGTPQIIEHLLDIDSHVDQFKWESFKAGVDICRLYGNDDKGPSAALLRYAPGAEVPSHIHGGYEHILILSGSQTDGSDVFDEGTLLISAPGSQHSIASELGCIVLAIWQLPVKF